MNTNQGAQSEKVFLLSLLKMMHDASEGRKLVVDLDGSAEADAVLELCIESVGNDHVIGVVVTDVCGECSPSRRILNKYPDANFVLMPIILPMASITKQLESEGITMNDEDEHKKLLGEVSLAVLNAVARHHGASVVSLRDLYLISDSHFNIKDHCSKEDFQRIVESYKEEEE